MRSAVLPQVERLRTPDVVGAAPYLYIVARIERYPRGGRRNVARPARKLEPTWKLDGEWMRRARTTTQCIVGRNVARQFQLAPGGNIDLSYLGRSARLKSRGVVDAGAADDNQVFVNLPVAQQAGRPRLDKSNWCS